MRNKGSKIDLLSTILDVSVLRTNITQDEKRIRQLDAREPLVLVLVLPIIFTGPEIYLVNAARMFHSGFLDRAETRCPAPIFAY